MEDDEHEDRRGEEKVGEQIIAPSRRAAACGVAAPTTPVRKGLTPLRVGSDPTCPLACAIVYRPSGMAATSTASHPRRCRPNRPAAQVCPLIAAGSVWLRCGHPQ